MKILVGIKVKVVFVYLFHDLHLHTSLPVSLTSTFTLNPPSTQVNGQTYFHMSPLISPTAFLIITNAMVNSQIGWYRPMSGSLVSMCAACGKL